MTHLALANASPFVARCRIVIVLASLAFAVLVPSLPAKADCKVVFSIGCDELVGSVYDCSFTKCDIVGWYWSELFQDYLPIYDCPVAYGEHERTDTVMVYRDAELGETGKTQIGTGAIVVCSDKRPCEGCLVTWFGAYCDTDAEWEPAQRFAHSIGMGDNCWVN